MLFELTVRVCAHIHNKLYTLDCVCACILFFHVRCEVCGSSHYVIDRVRDRVVIRKLWVRGKHREYNENKKVNKGKMKKVQC